MDPAEKAKQVNQQKDMEPMKQALQDALGPLNQAVQSLQAQLAEVKAVQSKPQVPVQPPLEEVDLKALLMDVEGADESDDKYDKLSNRQILDIVSNAVQSTLESRDEQLAGAIKSTIDERTSKVDDLEKGLMAIAAGLGVNEARGKFKDFDDYKEDIQRIAGEIPGISWERAYILAKGERAKDVPPKSVVEREKPDERPNEPVGEHPGTSMTDASMSVFADRGRSQRMGPSKSGVQGFRNILSAAADKVLDNRE